MHKRHFTTFPEEGNRPHLSMPAGALAVNVIWNELRREVWRQSTRIHFTLAANAFWCIYSAFQKMWCPTFCNNFINC